MSRPTRAHLIAVLVPFIGVFAGILAFHDSTAELFGFPIIFTWLFLWMPLTSLVLHVAWRTEAPEYDDIDEHTDGVDAKAGH